MQYVFFSVARCVEHHFVPHLDALRIDTLSFFIPGHSRLGVPCCLAYEGHHSSRDTNHVYRNFGEPRWSW